MYELNSMCVCIAGARTCAVQQRCDAGRRGSHHTQSRRMGCESL